MLHYARVSDLGFLQQVAGALVFKTNHALFQAGWLLTDESESRTDLIAVPELSYDLQRTKILDVGSSVNSIKYAVDFNSSDLADLTRIHINR